MVCKLCIPLQWYELLQVAGKSSFKELILSTLLLSRARYMIMSSLLPANLKDNEAEQRNTYMYPSIPFVPLKESMEHSTKPKPMKIKVELGLQISYLIWSGGTPKALLFHIQSAQGAIKKKGYFKPFQNTSKSIKKFKKKVKETKDLITLASPIDPKVKKALEKDLDGYKMIIKNATLKEEKAGSKMFNFIQYPPMQGETPSVGRLGQEHDQI